MAEIKLVNCTPHSISILNHGTGEFETINASGILPRVSQTVEEIGKLGNYTLTQNTYGEVTNLPEPESNTFFIVSMMVKNACPERKDLLAVNETVRDSEGRIVGAKSFAQ